MTRPAPDAAPADKQRALDRILLDLESVVVAFSGGVDSGYLAVRAHQVLGERALAVTADSESLAGWQREQALELARRFGFAHRILRTGELANPLYARNQADRCYHCKAELFRVLRPLADAEGYRSLVYGLIVDDLTDFRPGQRAAVEAGARGPLAEAGITKADVRRLARDLGLPIWDLPASPCLSSRVAYGLEVNASVLRQVESAEHALRGLGFSEFRVRHLGSGARVEVAPGELPRLADPVLRAEVERLVRAAGYAEVELDAGGYRRGRMNDALRVVRSA
jgi:uncharacterized protein